MERKNFIKTLGVLGAGVIANRSFAHSLFLPTNPKGIHLPGSHSTIIDKSNGLNKYDDIERYKRECFAAFKKALLAQSAEIEAILEDFLLLPEKNRNGHIAKGTDSDGNLKAAMNFKGKKSVLPAMSHLSTGKGWPSSDILNSKICDLSLKALASDGSVTVKPLDNRKDLYPYTVTSDLAYLLYKPTYYCIGLPSSEVEALTVSKKDKEEIYKKTDGKFEATVSVYRRQEFTYMGSGICGPVGIKNPVTRYIYFDTDLAIEKWLNLVPVTECGDLSHPECNLKA
jgi:hypothetical protein